MVSVVNIDSYEPWLAIQIWGSKILAHYNTSEENKCVYMQMKCWRSSLHFDTFVNLSFLNLSML